MPDWIRVTLHIREIWPSFIPVGQQFAALVNVYRTIGVVVRLGGVEKLDARQPINPVLFQDIDAGQCLLDGTVTPQIAALHACRAGMGSNEPAAYFVRSVGRFTACSSHTPNIPACVIGQSATIWTLAHEFGHVLGLPHSDDSDNLMYGYGTENITNLPPNLTREQREVINSSQFAHIDTPELAAVRTLLQRDLPDARIVAGLPANSHDLLRTLAESSDPDIAAKAVHAAGLLASPEARLLVEEKLQDEREGVRHTATLALGGNRRPKTKLARGISTGTGGTARRSGKAGRNA